MRRRPLVEVDDLASGMPSSQKVRRTSQQDRGRRPDVRQAIPECIVPECDDDMMSDIFEKSQPVVFKRFALEWPLAGKTLAEVVRAGDGEPDTAVELQATGPGGCDFHGYRGIVERAPFNSLPELAARAQASLYLAQCPIWTREDPGNCPARRLLSQMRSSYFSPASGRRRGAASRLESMNLWVSVGATHSNLHYDSEHGLLIVFRGKKHAELFEPALAADLGAFPLSDPLRAHHAAAPHRCLASRMGCEKEAEACGSSLAAPCPCPRVHEVKGHQAVLEVGDALFIPEGWWHHVYSVGKEDSSAGGRPVALAANIWWRGYEREPESAQLYVVRRILCEMVARRTSICVGGRFHQPPAAQSMKSDALAALVSAAESSRPPQHTEWRRALLAHGRRLPQCLAAALAGPEDAAISARGVLDGLDGAQASLLLASLEGAAALEDGAEAATALRRMWRLYPQASLFAKWVGHRQDVLAGLLEGIV